MNRQEHETDRLRRAVEELTVLNRIAQAVGASNTVQDVIDELVKQTIRCLHAEQVVISLVDKLSGADPKTVVRHRASGSLPEFHLTQGLLGLMQHSGTPFLSNDPHGDEKLRGLRLPADLDSLLCVPLTVKGEIIGILAACNRKQGNAFDLEDQRLLSIIASQSAQVLDNARLREEERELEKIQRDLKLAREIQVGLLPDRAPALEGYELAASSIPALSVGGDYYDFVPLGADRLGICLGDVSGKGVPAALLMSNLQATIRGQAPINEDAAGCLNWANQLLYRSTPIEKFATVFFGILDPLTHRLNYTNAGHEHPIWLPSDGGEPQRLATGGLMLGILPDFSYLQETVPIEPGDLVFVYSDGATDATDDQDRPFGEETLLEVLRDSRGESAGAVLERVAAAITAHVGGAEPIDDITLLALKRLD